MGRLEDIIKKALEREMLKGKPTKLVNESRIVYEEGHSERVHPNLAKQLRDRSHTLGVHPIFPDSDESHFEEKIISKRFGDVLKNYKRQFDSETADPMDAVKNMMPLISDCMKLEDSSKEVLQELAINMVRKEYDMGEDDVEIIAELKRDIDIEGIRKNPSPVRIESMEFDNHDSVTSANGEVYKRRFINAMSQGAAKKGHHMFHLADKELLGINPTLPNKYAKMMAAADYGYLTMDDTMQREAGGVVKVEFVDGKPIIHAQAVVFPVLIHELVKGVMEILSMHGLPEDQKLTEYVLGKADYINAEPWDMRLGAPIWERFTDCIDSKDFDKKHHIYVDLVSLPTEEFNHTMREIMLGSKEGKDKIKEIVSNIDEDIKRDDYEASIKEMNNDDDSFGFDELDDIDLSNL